MFIGVSLDLKVVKNYRQEQQKNIKDEKNGSNLDKTLPSRELTYPPDKAYLKMIFLFPRWDMLISWRVTSFRSRENIENISHLFTVPVFPENGIDSQALWLAICRGICYVMLVPRRFKWHRTPPIGHQIFGWIWMFPKKMVVPNNHVVFLLKMIILGCEMGVPLYLETPILILYRSSRQFKSRPSFPAE